MCKCLKPLSEFKNCGGKKAHLFFSWCRPCERKWHRDYAARPEVKEKNRIKRKKYASENRERLLAKKRAYSKTEAGKISLKKSNDKSRKKYPDRHKARKYFYNNVLRKGFKVPEKCQQCGEGGKIQGHHFDYSKPLEVVWLCIDCHKKVHHLNLS